MHRSSLAVIFALATGACSQSQSPVLISGPYGGTTYAFWVDRLIMPGLGQDTADYGTGQPRNQLGIADGLLGIEQMQMPAQSVSDQLSAGALQMRVELTTEDAQLREDRTVGVRFLGGTLAEGDQLGAALHDGVLRSNRIRDLGEPAFATLPLPLFSDSDAVEWPLEAVEMDLVPDGNGGFDGQLHGAAELTLTHDDIVAAVYQSFLQMVAAHPDARAWAIHTFDVDGDGMISRAELAGNPWMKLALAADVQLHDAAGNFAPQKRLGDPRGNDAITIGLSFHLAPCRGATCPPPATGARCDDRVRNGDESDVDCGGSCGPCAASLGCSQDSECLSGTCVGGFCGVPTCSDGRRDGFEIDVDCGPGCTLCETGKRCYDDGDCLSGACVAGTCSAQVQVGATVSAKPAE